jgi:carbonic anhydrase
MSAPEINPSKLGAVTDDAFADVFSGNATYAEGYSGGGLSGTAARGLAIVTCMDSRIDPLSVVGMRAGDVKILRNAGARVTDDVLRTLILATHLLGVTRVLVMPHTDCRMASADEWTMHEQIRQASGIDSRGIEIRTVADQDAALRTDLLRLSAFPLLPKDLVVAGAILDLGTGRIRPIV